MCRHLYRPLRVVKCNFDDDDDDVMDSSRLGQPSSDVSMSPSSPSAELESIAVGDSLDSNPPGIDSTAGDPPTSVYA